MLSNSFNTLRSNLFSIGVLVTLFIGWQNRDSNYLSAETGAGYILGIVGGSLMIVLLLYPVSKRVAALTRLIPIRYWFGFHLFLGIVGPLLILFHSNFHLGSTNSSIALISMLLVAGSGVIGRYIYTKIHHGLYGARLTLKEVIQTIHNEHSGLLKLYAMDEKLSKQLTELEKKALHPYAGLLESLSHVAYLTVSTPRMKSKVMRLLKDSQQEPVSDTSGLDRKEVKTMVNNYLIALKQTASFRVYERLFSLWHILHLPLFFMMIITAVIHIFAVHMY